MHRRVSVQRKAIRDGHASTSRRRREREAQRPLKALVLASLESGDDAAPRAFQAIGSWVTEGMVSRIDV